MATRFQMPSPQLLVVLSRLVRLLSKPAHLQLLCLLSEGPADVPSLIAATGLSQSHISRQLGQLVDDLCRLVQHRLRHRVERQLQSLTGA